MGTATIEICRLATKTALYPGQIDRRTPNPLEIISVTSNNSTETESAAITEQAEYQDLWARVKVDEAAHVGVGSGSTDSSGGYALGVLEWSPWLPVRAGDTIAVLDDA